MIHHLYRLVQTTASGLESFMDWTTSFRCGSTFRTSPGSHADRIWPFALHSSLVALIDIIGQEALLMIEQFFKFALLLELNALRLLSQNASIIAVQVREQAAPIIPKIVRNCLVILFKLFV